MPNFLVIGAFKSGTTSLMSYLGQHPRIFVPWLQEPNYFGNPQFSTETTGDLRPQRDDIGYGRQRTRTLGQYLALFDDAAPDAVIGESSPQYMREPDACARIASMAPDVKLVAILRNPADRAFSDYSMFIRDGLETADFQTAIRRPQSHEPLHHYVQTGFYARQLQPYFDAFPRDQIRILLYEDLAEPLKLLSELFGWLGVDDSFTPDVAEIRNVSGVPRNRLIANSYRLRRYLQPRIKPLVPRTLQRAIDRQLTRGLRKEVVDPAARRELIAIYSDDVKDLSQLIGRNLDHWLV